MRLLLIRHGETARNAGQVTLGREDVPLNELGLRQAEALRERLAGAEAFGVVNAVYSSPLQRSLSTANPLAEALALPVQVDDRLIEMDVGELEGHTYAALRERYPEFLRAWRSDALADAVMPGGESLRQVQERAWAAIEAIRDRHADATVAVVSHNFVIRSVLCRVLELSLARFRRLQQDLAAVSTLELTSDGQTIVGLNDRWHLAGVERG